jgi:hypothetical protein
MKEPFGLDEWLTPFRDAFHKGTLAPAWLFTGPRGVGKKTTVFALTAEVLQKAGGDAKQVNAQLEAGSHPDAFIRRALAMTDLPMLRSFLKHPALHPGGWKVLILSNIDVWNPSVTNALLKSLETPPPRTLFLTTATRIQPILPTLRSRLVIQKVSPYRHLKDFQQALAVLAPSFSEGGALSPEVLFERSKGCLGRALKLIQNDHDGSFPDWPEIIKALLPETHPSYVPLEPLTHLTMEKLTAFLEMLQISLEQSIRDVYTGQTPPEDLISLVVKRHSPARWGERLRDLRKWGETAQIFHLDSGSFYSNLPSILMSQGDPLKSVRGAL